MCAGVCKAKNRLYSCLQSEFRQAASPCAQRAAAQVSSAASQAPGSCLITLPWRPVAAPHPRTCFDLPQRACLCAALEGRVATQQDVHDHASRPDVRQAVIVLVQHVRGNVPAAAYAGRCRQPQLKTPNTTSYTTTGTWHAEAGSRHMQPDAAYANRCLPRHELLLHPRYTHQRPGYGQLCAAPPHLMLSPALPCSPLLALTLPCQPCCAGAAQVRRSLQCQSQ